MCLSADAEDENKTEFGKRDIKNEVKRANEMGEREMRRRRERIRRRRRRGREEKKKEEKSGVMMAR